MNRVQIGIAAALLATLAWLPAQAYQPATAAALSGAPQSKVAASPPAASTTAGKGSAGAPQALSDNPLIQAAIDNVKARGIWSDLMWNDTLRSLAAQDPKIAARLINQIVWNQDLQDAVAKQNRGLQGQPVVLPASVRGTVQLADGRRLEINWPRLATGYGSSGDVQGSVWAESSRHNLVQGDNVLIQQTFVLEGGDILVAPNMSLPIAGGTRTAELPGGGTITLTLTPLPPGTVASQQLPSSLRINPSP